MAQKQVGMSEENLSSHDRILLSAKNLFAKDGYDNTSTAAIARMAGTSESQLMKHFGSKEGLLEAIFDAGWASMAYMFRAIHDLHSPTEKLEVMLEMILNTLERDPELRDLMLLEGRRIRKEGHMILLTKGYLQFIGVLDAILTEMRATGELRTSISNDAVRSALNSVTEGMMRDLVMAQRMGFPAHYSKEDLRQVFRLIMRAFVTAD
ncbi:MAG: TetR/AcrR family transcriptional regulator [Terriglobales bacterium]